MNFEIYAYWNTVELANVFNAVVAITGSGDFNGLLRTLALAMIIGLAVAVLAGKNKQEDFWRWVIILAVMHGMLLVPKSTVTIVDRTGTKPPQVVANVPIGIAALAHGTSKIGDWLTTAFETVFSLPDDIQLRKSGTLFGHRVMLERLSTQFASPVLMRNLDEFYRECVIPDLATGMINPNDLAKSENIWQLFANTNPGLMVTIANYNNPATTYTVSCPVAYNTLTNQINTDANAVLGLKAQGLYPEIPLALAKASLSNALINTQQFFAPSASATPVLDQIKQGAMCNYIIDAPARVAAQMGDAAQVQQATATAAGIRSYKANISSAYAVAMSGMPKFRNAIEMIAYAVFPIIVVMIVIAGQHAGTFLKGYVGTLLWVQLWPPLYAIMNYMMNIKSKSAISSMVAANSNRYLSCDMTNWLGTTAIDDMNVAAYLTLSIPLIAWGLVKGTLNAASSVVASSLQGAGATGARYLENTIRSDQITAGQYNMAPVVATGATMFSDIDPSGIKINRSANGEITVDATAISNKTNIATRLASQARNALQQASENAEQAAMQNAVSAATATTAAIQQAINYAHQHSRGNRNDTNWGVSDQAGFMRAVNTVERLQKEFADQYGLSQAQAAQVLGYAQLGGNYLVAGAAARLTGISNAQAQDMLQKARKFAQDSGYNEAVNRLKNFVKNETFNQSDESTRRAMESISANFDRSDQLTEQASANYQRSLSYKEAASRDQEQLGMWAFNSVRQFLDWMTTQRNDQDILGRPFDYRTVAQIAEHNPEFLIPYLNRFFKEKMEPLILSGGFGDVKTGGDVWNFFNQSAIELRREHNIMNKGVENLNRVMRIARDNGVDPQENVNSDTPNQVEKGLGNAKRIIDEGAARIDTEGQAIVKNVKAAEDPGSLAATAIYNAINNNGLIPEEAKDYVKKFMDDHNIRHAQTTFGKRAVDYESGGGSAAGAGGVADAAPTQVGSTAAGAGSVGNAADGGSTTNSTVDGAIKYGQNVAGEVVGGMDLNLGGKSNLGRLLGGAPRQAPTPTSSGNQSGEQQKPGDTPPPSGR